MGKVERPIIMQREMVRANLKGIKTETRRLAGLNHVNESPDSWKLIGFKCVDKKGRIVLEFQNIETKTIHLVTCPYGQPGDILYVRENWIEFGKPGVPKAYAADFQKNEMFGKHRPSIHLKKKYCRIWLEIIKIGIERLHDITEQSAIDEGISSEIFDLSGGERKVCYYFYPCMDLRDDTYVPKATTSYASLFASINGWESWEANPWVFVITYRMIQLGVKAQNL